MGTAGLEFRVKHWAEWQHHCVVPDWHCRFSWCEVQIGAARGTWLSRLIHACQALPGLTMSERGQVIIALQGTAGHLRYYRIRHGVAWHGGEWCGAARPCCSGLQGRSGVLSTGVELRALISDFMAFRSEGVRE